MIEIDIRRLIRVHRRYNDPEVQHKGDLELYDFKLLVSTANLLDRYFGFLRMLEKTSQVFLDLVIVRVKVLRAALLQKCHFAFDIHIFYFIS